MRIFTPNCDPQFVTDVLGSYFLLKFIRGLKKTNYEYVTYETFEIFSFLARPGHIPSRRFLIIPHFMHLYMEHYSVHSDAMHV